MKNPLKTVVRDHDDYLAPFTSQHAHKSFPAIIINLWPKRTTTESQICRDISCPHITAHTWYSYMAARERERQPIHLHTLIAFHVCSPRALISLFAQWAKSAKTCFSSLEGRDDLPHPVYIYTINWFILAPCRLSISACACKSGYIGRQVWCAISCTRALFNFAVSEVFIIYRAVSSFDAALLLSRVRL